MSKIPTVKPNTQKTKQVDPRKTYNGTIPVVVIGKKNVNTNN